MPLDSEDLPITESLIVVSGDPAKVPAIDITIAASLGDGRHLQLRTAILQETDPDTANTVLGNVMKLCDRQKAVYDLEAAEREFRKSGFALANFIAQIPYIELTQRQMREQWEREIDGVLADQQLILDNAIADHIKAGRSGPYHPRGAVKSQVEAHSRSIAQKRENIRRSGEDQEQEKQKALSIIHAHQRELKAHREKVDALRATAGLPASTEFLTEEAFKAEEAG